MVDLDMFFNKNNFLKKYILLKKIDWSKYFYSYKSVVIKLGFGSRKSQMHSDMGICLCHLKKVIWK
jgi:hypothetical protein